MRNMPESQTPDTDETAKTTPSQQTGGAQIPSSNQRRRPDATNRNSNLASMANAERGFPEK